MIKGYLPFIGNDGRAGIRVLVEQGGEKTREKLKAWIAGEAKKYTDGLDFDVGIWDNEADIYKITNDWKAKPHGQDHLARILQISGGRPVPDVDRFRPEFETLYEREIRAAEDRIGPQGPGGPGGLGGGGPEVQQSQGALGVQRGRGDLLPTGVVDEWADTPLARAAEERSRGSAQAVVRPNPTDPEGRPLIAKFVAGVREEGGPDLGLSASQIVRPATNNGIYDCRGRNVRV